MAPYTYSKLTIETLDQVVKYVQIRNKDNVIGFLLVPLLLTLNIFHKLFY